MEDFDLREDDWYAVELAKEAARRLLKHPKIAPPQVLGLGNALYALDRLPKSTSGAFVEFGVSYRVGTSYFSEMKFISFIISESVFEISKGGSVYSKSIGSDSFSAAWLIERNGYREAGYDLSDLEQDIEAYIRRGAEIDVSEGSAIEYDFD